MKILAKNKKAYFNYQILETYIAGIVLEGSEVKSVKAGQINLSDSYATIDQNQEIWLINCHIPLYKYAGNVAEYDPTKARNLLLKKSEIKRLIGKIKEQGLTLVPIKVYNKGGLIKLEFGVGKGKSKIDKRETIKKRETERKLRRIKQQY